MHEFTWFSFFYHDINHHNVHIFSAAFIAVIITLMAGLAYRKLRHTEERLIPSPKGSLVNLLEIAVEKILDLMEGVMGSRQVAERFFPLIGTIFIFILLCNLMGVIPGFLPPTDNVNTNFAISITVFLYYNYCGVREHGIKNYLKHFMGPIIWLAPLIFVIELIGHVVRPVSLSLRLFGNMTGDHLVLGIFSSLVPVLIPVIFMGLGVFISFIQAFVFTLLTMVYIALAVAHEEH
jgi:F-type H+-transporting ATPase subunit a